MIDEREVWAQIGTVLDPELDRPLDALGFVESVRVDGADILIQFRLPTYWCAPNFAYMMAADLRERVGRVAGVGSVTVRLLDHFADGEITEGINAGRTFADVFAGETDGDLDDLRRTFQRKAFLVRQEQLLRALLRVGYSAERLARWRGADVRVDGTALLVRAETGGMETDEADADGEATALVAGTAWRRLDGLARTYRLYRQKRSAVGLSARDADPLFSTADGAPLTGEGVVEHLRAARTIRLNGSFNTILCTALNRITHGVEVDAEALRDETAG